MYRFTVLLSWKHRKGLPALLPIAAILFAGVFAGCSTTPRPEPVVVVPNPPPRSPVKTTETSVVAPVPEPEVVEEAPVKAVELSKEPNPAEQAAEDLALILSGQLGLEENAVVVVEAADSVWPNACLGFPAEGEICAQVLTPGYAVTLEAEGQRFSFRTDESLDRIRLVAAPLPDIGITLAIWKDTQSSFATATIGSRGLAVGLRGCPKLTVRDRSADREWGLGELVARFAPFRAATEAGEIDFRGNGTEVAVEVEQRMIAEWVRAYSRSVSFGGDPEISATVLSWERTGGIAGFCDIVAINAGGEVIISDCRGGRERRLAHTWLDRRQLTEFFGWVDSLDSFASDQTDGGQADALDIRITLQGQGWKKINPETLEAMHRLASDLYLRGYDEANGS